MVSVQPLKVLALAACISIPQWSSFTYGQSSGNFTEASALFDQAMQEYQQQNLENAASLFKASISADKAYVNRHRGSAHLWLGKLYGMAGDEERMRRTWHNAITVQQERGTFDFLLADRYVQHIFGVPLGAIDTEEAARVYLEILTHGQSAVTPEERAVVSRHLAQLALILPGDFLSLLPDLAGQGKSIGLSSESVARIRAWWRRQDPMPATSANERLEEHLRRTVAAGQEYPSDDHPSGLDVRGHKYVQYGAPQLRTSVRFDEPDIIRRVLAPGYLVKRAQFVENEFWVYRPLGRRAYFLFARIDGEFRIAEPHDLLPRSVKAGFSDSRRGLQRSVMAIAMLRNIYEQLARIHPDFGLRFMEVDNYARYLEESEKAAPLTSLQAARRAGSAEDSMVFPRISPNVSGAVPHNNPFMDAPHTFAQRVITSGHLEDQYYSWERDRTLPTAYSNVLDPFEKLPVAFRTARFLDPDGLTRTEVFWAPEPGGLDLHRRARRQLEETGLWKSDQFLLSVAGVQKDLEYFERTTEREYFLVTDIGSDALETIPARTLVIRGDTAAYHLALQWNQHSTAGSHTPDDLLHLGPVIKVAVANVDSIEALSPSAGAIEMSDLMPVMMQGRSDVVLNDEYLPYPFSYISTTTPLGIYFEVYHLQFDGDDKTHFTVEYEVRKPRRAGRGIFASRQEVITSAAVTMSANSSTVKELVMLDMADVTRSEQISINVRVRDLVSGSTADRALHFDAVYD